MQDAKACEYDSLIVKFDTCEKDFNSINDALKKDRQKLKKSKRLNAILGGVLGGVAVGFVVVSTVK